MPSYILKSPEHKGIQTAIIECLETIELLPTLLNDRDGLMDTLEDLNNKLSELLKDSLLPQVFLFLPAKNLPLYAQAQHLLFIVKALTSGKYFIAEQMIIRFNDLDKPFAFTACSHVQQIEDIINVTHVLIKYMEPWYTQLFSVQTPSGNEHLWESFKIIISQSEPQIDYYGYESRTEGLIDLIQADFDAIALELKPIFQKFYAKNYTYLDINANLIEVRFRLESILLNLLTFGFNEITDDSVEKDFILQLIKLHTAVCAELGFITSSELPSESKSYMQYYDLEQSYSEYNREVQDSISQYLKELDELVFYADGLVQIKKSLFELAVTIERELLLGLNPVHNVDELLILSRFGEATDDIFGQLVTRPEHHVANTFESIQESISILLDSINSFLAEGSYANEIYSLLNDLQDSLTSWHQGIEAMAEETVNINRFSNENSGDELISASQGEEIQIMNQTIPKLTELCRLTIWSLPDVKFIEQNDNPGFYNLHYADESGVPNIETGIPDDVYNIINHPTTENFTESHQRNFGKQ